LQSVDELLEFMETWVFAISFGTFQPVNTSEKAIYMHVQAPDFCDRMYYCMNQHPSSLLAASIKVTITVTGKLHSNVR